MANLTGAEDLLNEGTCNWSCTVDTANATGGVLRDTLAKGELIKLEIMYEERVDSEKCANQTKPLNTNSTAIVLLKRATDHEANMSQGSMAFFTQTILVNIYSGQVFIGGYKEIKVSCIFRPTSVTNSAMNFANQRLTFHTPQSILYYVENLANYTKSDSTFLTLVRVERQTRVYLVHTGPVGNSSLAWTKDNELLTFSNGWLFVAVIIWIVFVLYSPSIFLLFRPSKVKLQLPQKRRGENIDDTFYPLQETGDSGGFIESDIRPGHGPPTEHGDVVNDTNTSAKDNYPSANEGIDGETNKAWSFPQPDRSQEEVGASIYEETTKPHHRNSKMVGSFHPDRRPVPLGQESKHGSLTMSGPTRDANLDLDDTNNTDVGSRNAATGNEGHSEEITSIPTSDGLPPDVRDTELISRADENSDPGSSSSDTSGVSCVSRLLRPFRRRGRRSRPLRRPTKRFETRTTPPATQTTSDGTYTDDLPGIEEPSDGNNVAVEVPIDIPEPNHLETGTTSASDGLEHSSLGREIAQRTSNVQPTGVIVGDTNPLGVGSTIGNRLFLSANRNKFCRKMVKLIFIFTVPLLFIGFGDLLLLMLPSLSVRLSVHLPFPFLTTSVVNSVLENHPAVQFLVVLSALCYIFRLICVCFLASDTSENTLVPCSLHTKHFTCFVFETFKSVVSQFPKSLCNLKTLSSPCLRKHMICTACYACYRHFKTLCISLSPCGSCKETAGECSEYLDVPQNILHNLEKQPIIVIKYWDSFFECITSYNKTNRFIWCVKIFFCPLAVVPFLIDVFLLSPLVCLCHGRQRILKERFKNKFKGSKFILPIIESFLTLFSLVWLILLLVGSAVPLGVVIVGLIKTLATHTNKILPELGILIFSFLYFWSCYRTFTILYYDLVKLLFSTYQKKFDEQEKKPGINMLISPYKQERQGNYVKGLPEELFNDACEHLKKPIRNQVALLIVKLVFTSLVFLFVWPIISDEAVMTMGDGVVTTVTFFAVTYSLINNAINENKLEVSQGTPTKSWMIISRKSKIGKYQFSNHCSYDNRSK